MPSNQQFITTNATTCINAVPVNATLVKGYSKSDLIPIPNSIPATYTISFQLNDGTSTTWKYQGATALTDRDTDFAAVNTALATAV